MKNCVCYRVVNEVPDYGCAEKKRKTQQTAHNSTQPGLFKSSQYLKNTWETAQVLKWKIKYVVKGILCWNVSKVVSRRLLVSQPGGLTAAY